MVRHKQRADRNRRDELIKTEMRKKDIRSFFAPAGRSKPGTAQGASSGGTFEEAIDLNSDSDSTGHFTMTTEEVQQAAKDFDLCNDDEVSDTHTQA